MKINKIKMLAIVVLLFVLTGCAGFSKRMSPEKKNVPMSENLKTALMKQNEKPAAKVISSGMLTKEEILAGIEVNRNKQTETEAAPTPEIKEEPAAEMKESTAGKTESILPDIVRRLTAVEMLSFDNKDRVARAEDMIKFNNPKTDVNYVEYSAGKSALNPAAIKYLNEKIALHKAGKIEIKAVIGSASPAGAQRINQKLSEDRAQVIANYLKTKGGILVPVVKGDGETDRYINGQRAALYYENQ